MSFTQDVGNPLCGRCGNCTCDERTFAFFDLLRLVTLASRVCGGTGRFGESGGRCGAAGMDVDGAAQRGGDCGCCGRSRSASGVEAAGGQVCVTGACGTCGDEQYAACSGGRRCVVSAGCDAGVGSCVDEFLRFRRVGFGQCVRGFAGERSAVDARGYGAEAASTGGDGVPRAECSPIGSQGCEGSRGSALGAYVGCAGRSPIGSQGCEGSRGSALGAHIGCAGPTVDGAAGVAAGACADTRGVAAGGEDAVTRSEEGAGSAPAHGFEARGLGRQAAECDAESEGRPKSVAVVCGSAATKRRNARRRAQRKKEWRSEVVAGTQGAYVSAFEGCDATKVKEARESRLDALVVKNTLERLEAEERLRIWRSDPERAVALVKSQVEATEAETEWKRRQCARKMWRSDAYLNSDTKRVMRAELEAEAAVLRLATSRGVRGWAETVLSGSTESKRSVHSEWSAKGKIESVSADSSVSEEAREAKVAALETKVKALELEVDTYRMKYGSDSGYDESYEAGLFESW